MWLLIFTLVSLLITVITFIITKLVLIKKDKEGQNVIIPRNILSGTGFLGAFVFLIISIITYLQDGNTGEYYVFIDFVWFSLLLLYGWFGMITVYDDEGFSQGWLPLQKKRYTYEMVIGFNVTLTRDILYVGKKSISFDSRLTPSDNFILFVSSKYRNIHGKNIPIKKRIPKWDIFNGHVEEPAEFIFIFLMLIGITAGSCAWLLFEAHDYKTIEETTCVEVTLDEYIIDENHMTLKAENVLCDFEIVRYMELEGIESVIEREIVEKNNLYLYVLDYEGPDNAKETYEVYAIQRVDGESIMSLEEKNKNDSEYAKSFMTLAIGFLIFVLIFCISTIVVGRYPHKFSKRVQRAFFKDGYLH